MRSFRPLELERIIYDVLYDSLLPCPLLFRGSLCQLSPYPYIISHSNVSRTSSRVLVVLRVASKPVTAMDFSTL